jgi:hypothetical protein
MTSTTCSMRRRTTTAISMRELSRERIPRTMSPGHTTAGRHGAWGNSHAPGLRGSSADPNRTRAFPASRQNSDDHADRLVLSGFRDALDAELAQQMSGGPV